MVGGLHHSQPRGVDGSGSTCYQLLQPLSSTARATQWMGPKFVPPLPPMQEFKTRTTPLHPQLDGVVKCYIKIAEHRPWKVVALHQKHLEVRLPNFLLAYRTSTQRAWPQIMQHSWENSACPVTCYLVHPPTRSDPASTTLRIWWTATWHPKYPPTSEAGQLCRLPGRRWSVAVSPKLQPTWEVPYRLVTRINNVVYRIQRHPRTKMVVVHFDQLLSYQGLVEMSSPMEEAVGGQQCETQPTRKKVWKRLKLEVMSTPALRWSSIHEGKQRCHRHNPLREKEIVVHL
jgi:hypothetical protein